jgi:DNA repair protein RadD
VQIIIRRLERLNWAPTLIVVDEAHHATHQTGHGKLLAHYAESKVLGVTATPSRLDGRGLGVVAGGFFDELVIGPSVAERVAQGYLSRPVVFAPATGIDLSAVRTLAGDFEKGTLADAMDRPRITGNAVEHYRRHCAGEPALVFCMSVALAEHVAGAFAAAGYQAASIDAPSTTRPAPSALPIWGRAGFRC